MRLRVRSDVRGGREARASAVVQGAFAFGGVCVSCVIFALFLVPYGTRNLLHDAEQQQGEYNSMGQVPTCPMVPIQVRLKFRAGAAGTSGFSCVSELGLAAMRDLTYPC